MSDLNNQNIFESIVKNLFKFYLRREIDAPSQSRYLGFYTESSFSKSIEMVIAELTNSQEYRHRTAIETIAKAQFNKYSKMREVIDAQTTNILVLQTSDPISYIPILDASSIFNERYCDIRGFQYKKYVGIKRGIYPHHAMFNRIYLLKELVDANYGGWVLYVDADALIVDDSTNLIEHFDVLRKQNKYAHFHSVESSDNEFWNINDGVFAIDLGSKFGRALINTWYLFYETNYCEIDYESGMDWNSVINDQTSLHVILRALGEERVRDFCALDYFLQTKLCNQFIRSSASEMPAQESIQMRVKAIIERGRKITSW